MDIQYPRIISSLVVKYTIESSQKTCSLCNNNYTPRQPLEIYEERTSYPICQSCSLQYATELNLLLQEYYNKIPEQERQLLKLFKA